MYENLDAARATSGTLRPAAKKVATAAAMLLALASSAGLAHAQTGDYQIVAVGSSTTAFGRIIIAGATGSNNGICDDPIIVAGDDVQVVLPGNSTPRQVGIRRDANLVLDSTPAGDDVATAAICAGANNVFDSVASGDDVITPFDLRCAAICPTAACLLPGQDDILDTIVAGDDATAAFLSTGANGILQSTTSGDDKINPSVVGVGGGLRDATCVNAGPDGIAQTGLCGNAFVDFAEECDTGPANSDTTPDACRTACLLPKCGDAVVDPANGESCEENNNKNNDDCLVGCVAAVCGDGIRKTTGTPPLEQCDDGNASPGDGCDALCQEETPVECGNGLIDSPYCSGGRAGSCTGVNSDCDTVPEAGDGVCTIEACDDGNNSSRDNCLTNCTLATCGDGSVHATGTGPFEECDDGNLSPGDGCNATCQTECGNGVVDGVCSQGLLNQGCAVAIDCDTTPGAGDGICITEACDDGNSKNNDDCVLGCVVAACGDGLRRTSGTPPFEQCDDGNAASGDGCDAQCQQEHATGCGNGLVDPPYCTGGRTGTCTGVNSDCDTSLDSGDGVCTVEACDDGNNSNRDNCLTSCTLAACGDGALHNTGTGPFEQCDDDNLSPGDGCSATCENECGNGVIDGACSQGLLNDVCTVDTDCDTSPGAGDGACLTEACDPGLAGLCVAGPGSCSALCTIASCGNGEVECSEECDLGPGNGASGSGCTALCERTLVGQDEVTKGSECPGAWTLDSAPQDLRRRKQVCTDGAACDFDGVVNDECVFSVGICVNRTLPATCARGPVVTVDMLRLDTSESWAAAAAEQLTEALGALTSGASEAPGRCREGQAGKNCAENVHCDSYLGAGDGRCDVATGVAYIPPLDAFGASPNQLAPCTPGQPVTVPIDERITLRGYVRRDAPLSDDHDNLRLFCIAPELP